MNKVTALLVEDSAALARLYLEYLRDEPYRVEHVETGTEALARLTAEPAQLVLLDLRLPDMDGLEILRFIRDRGLPSAVVVITAHGSLSVAVDAMRAGALDFLVKPFTAERLVYTIRHVLQRQRLGQLDDSYETGLSRDALDGFVGASPPMQAMYRVIDSAAQSKATVFITGESGTGKELCAEAIHRRSPRVGKPFVAINCAAIPRELIESELFGHVRGAFTGATDDRAGAAARADGGTLFLDEICEMDILLQSKLLRFVQTGSFTPVGSNRPQAVDVRIVCATNRDPMAAVREGRFREDLYYRLHVVPVHMPPLRERGEDVITIARHFLGRFAAEEGKSLERFAPEVEARFAAYDWPGNVRQLENTVRNIVVLNDGSAVTAEMLPPPLRELSGANARLPAAAPAEAPPAGVRPLWQVEREAIETAIARCGGNVVKAAALLEVSPSTIYRKLRAWQTAEPATSHPTG